MKTHLYFNMPNGQPVIVFVAHIAYIDTNAGKANIHMNTGGGASATINTSYKIDELLKLITG
ncbi:MAG TPA: hypothetical protein VK154_08875 [Chitinophagales bacterium]|nr:hypothetical protein [Chitinophagales bacterium]